MRHTPQGPRRSSRIPVRPVTALLLTMAIALAALLGRLPLPGVAAYAAMGIASFAAYGLDKTRAIKGEWRTSEARLHFVDIMGGVIGGLVGQQYFRHKTSKLSFMRTTFTIAALHGIGLAALASGVLDLSQVDRWLARIG